MDWFKVCEAWGRVMRQAKPSPKRENALREYLIDEKLINGVDFNNVRERTVQTGMTACGVFASLGMPEDVNTTTTAHATRQQLVYRQRRMYVYTESRPNDHNGLVRSVQH